MYLGIGPELLHDAHYVRLKKCCRLCYAPAELEFGVSVKVAPRRERQASNTSSTSTQSSSVIFVSMAGPPKASHP